MTRIAVLAAALLLAATASADSPPFRTQSFDSDPGWGSLNAQGSGACYPLHGAFGWQPDGRIGGVFYRATDVRGSYATPVGPFTFADSFDAAGTVTVPVKGNASVLFGFWSSASSLDKRTADSFVIDVAPQHRAGYSLIPEVTSRNYLAVNPSNGGTKNDVRYPYGQTLRWTLSYDAAAATAELDIDDLAGVRQETDVAVVPPDLLADGLQVDRFGFLTVQSFSTSTVTAYVDDLTVNGQPYSFDTDPGWEAVNATVDQPDCWTPNRQSFGWQPAGEAGGTFWRTRVGWYADQTMPLGAGDALYATGRVELEQATTDTDIYLGWFNDGASSEAASSFQPLPNGHLSAQSNMVGVHLGGLTRYGYRLIPIYRAAFNPTLGYSVGATGADDDGAPWLTPHGASRVFAICYQPGSGALSGHLTVSLAGDPDRGVPGLSEARAVTVGVRGAGLELDRFGWFVGDTGGKSMRALVDDVRYTVAKGDACQ